jgi:hypothetical protein
MAFRPYRVLHHPRLQDDLQSAPSALLLQLGRYAYPLLRSNPTDESGRHPITWSSPWFYLTVRCPGGVADLVYQVIEDERLVMVWKLLWVPDGPP